MIPKIIHYCWFGGKELSDFGKYCISSWKKYCPDYEIIEWNESNYDYSKCIYVREAYEAEKWAFVSDYVRLDVIYRYGGIYLDVDVEVIKNLDFLLNCACFLPTETTNMISSGLGFGAERGNANIKLMLDQYKNIHFKIGDGLYDTLPCPHRNTRPFLKMGFQTSDRIQCINGAVIYPVEYFCPMDYQTKELIITENTVSIHHYSASWLSEKEKKLNASIREYRKHHGKIRSKLHKNCVEYELYYGSFQWSSMKEFISKKLKRRWNRFSHRI